jgi:hypothetical protein
MEPCKRLVVFGLLLNFEREFLELGHQLRARIVHHSQNVETGDVL